MYYEIEGKIWTKFHCDYKLNQAQLFIIQGHDLVLLSRDQPSKNLITRNLSISTCTHFFTGQVQVSYTISQGALDPIKPANERALNGSDFVGGAGFVDFADGSSSEPISILIYEDDIPELDEVFLVTLNSVELMGSGDVNTPPKLGKEYAVNYGLVHVYFYATHIPMKFLVTLNSVELIGSMDVNTPH